MVSVTHDTGGLLFRLHQSICLACFASAWRGASVHRSQVSFVPVLFAALLDHHSNLEPAEIPANRRYIFQDAERWAVYLGLKFKSPLLMFACGCLVPADPSRLDKNEKPGRARAGVEMESRSEVDAFPNS